MNSTHFISLNVTGGIELICAALVSALDRSGQASQLILKGDTIHEQIRKRLPANIDSFRFKAPLGLRLPDTPALLRRLAYRRRLSAFHPDVMLSWSQINAGALAWAHHALGARVLHYEHGSAWLSTPSRHRRGYLDSVDGIICVSHAARRMIELRWQTGPQPMAVRHNPMLFPVETTADELATRQPGRYRLGMAGRLVPVKGFPIAIQALAELVRQGVDAELHIVGIGPMQAPLEALSAHLGLGERVILHGFRPDMGDFLRTLDVMLCPSLRETFGMVSVEAAAHGCPVIASRVDGLPETLEENVTGLTLPCDQPLSSLPLQANSIRGIPPQVYDPDTDALREPRGVDPLRLAEAIGNLLEDHRRHQHMRRAGVEHARRHFALNDYVADMQQLMAELGRRTSSGR